LQSNPFKFINSSSHSGSKSKEGEAVAQGSEIYKGLFISKGRVYKSKTDLKPRANSHSNQNSLSDIFVGKHFIEQGESA
jgi:hypothetical protein